MEKDRKDRKDGKNILIIGLNLRDLYGRYQEDKINNWIGLKKENMKDGIGERAAIDSLELRETGSKNFMKCNDIVVFLARNYSKEQENFYVNIVVPGLQSKYFENRNFLTKDERDTLEFVRNSEQPIFFDIYKYRSVKKYKKYVNIREYQLFGSLNPYEVLNIPVKHFINSLNEKKPINVKLGDTNLVIQLQYETSDFYDKAIEKTIGKINI